MDDGSATLTSVTLRSRKVRGGWEAKGKGKGKGRGSESPGSFYSHLPSSPARTAITTILKASTLHNHARRIQSEYAM